jgi:hypothetical protein
LGHPLSFILTCLIKSKDGQSVKHWFRAGSTSQPIHHPPVTALTGSTVSDLELMPDGLVVEVKMDSNLPPDLFGALFGASETHQKFINNCTTPYSFALQWPTSENDKISKAEQPLLQVAAQLAHRCSLSHMGIATSVKTSIFCVIPNKKAGTKRRMYISRACAYQTKVELDSMPLLEHARGLHDCGRIANICG